MVRVGVQANDLPGILLLLADYYRNLDSVWIRLRGLMVYSGSGAGRRFGFVLPVRIFLPAVKPRHRLGKFLLRYAWNRCPAMGLMLGVWVPPLFIGILLVVTLLALLKFPRPTDIWPRRLPAFKEAKLAQFASAMQLMLKSGGNLNDALALRRSA